MPHLQELHEELAGRDDAVILAVNAGLDSRETVEKYWSSSEFTLPAVLDSADQAGGDTGAITQALGARIFPTNIVVGPDGRVLYSAVGYDEGRLRELLGLD